MSDKISIRNAIPSDAKILSRLAMRSKAYWGYSDDFLQTCAQELAVSPDKINNKNFNFAVAEKLGNIAGYYGLEYISNGTYELEALFVKPEHIDSGIGSLLMQHAKQYVANNHGRTIRVQSDPNAEGFYRAMGGKLIGRRESASIPGRYLPVFTITVSA